MAELHPSIAAIQLQSSLLLDEQELAALLALAAYGDSLDLLFHRLGNRSLGEHEPALRRIFTTISETAPAVLARSREIRAILNNMGDQNG